MKGPEIGEEIIKERKVLRKIPTDQNKRFHEAVGLKNDRAFSEGTEKLSIRKDEKIPVGKKN